MAETSADPSYKEHYLHHRTKPPVRVTDAKQEAEYKRNGYGDAYLHQGFPTTRYHSTYDPALEQAVSDALAIEPNQTVIGRLVAARDRQRAQKVKQVESDAAVKALGKDWVAYGDVPAVKAKVAAEMASEPDL